MNKYSSAAVSIPDIDGKETSGGRVECPGMAIKKSSIGRSISHTPVSPLSPPNRKNSFFRRISVAPGTTLFKKYHSRNYKLFYFICDGYVLISVFNTSTKILGSFRSVSMIDSVDMSLGSLRHSSMQGMPPLVAMTPDIEQKLVRTRASDMSSESSGITNKVRLSSLLILSNFIQLINEN